VPKPSALPRWATDALAKVTEPLSGLKDLGWNPGDAPTAQHLNWLFNNIYKWAQYLNGLTAEVLTWTAAHTFNAGISSTGIGDVPGGLFTGGGHEDGASSAAPGLMAMGGPDMYGVIGEGGGGAPGGGFTGGEDGGIGVTGQGTGAALGGSFTGGPDGGGGVRGQGAGNGAGVTGQGSGTGAGGHFTGSFSDNSPGLVATGGGTFGPGMRVAGAGTGPAMYIDSGRIQFLTDAPDSDEGFSNALTSKNFSKAQASILTGTGVLEGFNIEAVTNPSPEVLHVDFVSNMASSNYSVVVTSGNTAGHILSHTNKTASGFDIRGKTLAGADVLFNAAGIYVDFHVNGAQ